MALERVALIGTPRGARLKLLEFADGAKDTHAGAIEDDE
jgi:hypothetical protein